MTRPPESYIRSGLSVEVPARIASLILRRLGLDELRRVGIQDPELAVVLYALEQVARKWRSTSSGTTIAPPVEPATRSIYAGTTEASQLLQVTRRAVQKAIDEKRLPAHMIDNRWQIAREDIAHFKASKTTR